MRYFQTDLASGDTTFKPGTHWDEIADIYYLDSTLRTYLLRGIQTAEVAIRSAFSLSECSLHSSYEQYLQTNAYRPPKNNRALATELLIASELERSREPFIQKYRDDTSWREAESKRTSRWYLRRQFSYGSDHRARLLPGADKATIRVPRWILETRRRLPGLPPRHHAPPPFLECCVLPPTRCVRDRRSGSRGGAGVEKYSLAHGLTMFID